MAESWAADVKKYVPGRQRQSDFRTFVKYCGSLFRIGIPRWSPSRTLRRCRVRNNFLKKKLGLTRPRRQSRHGDMSAAEKMKGDRTKIG